MNQPNIVSQAPVAVIYPVPVEEVAATDFRLTVDGQPVFTHQARVSAQPFNQIWAGYQRPLEQTEIASFASWDMTQAAEIVIESARAVNEVRVRPRSCEIEPRVEGNTIRFRIEKPGQYTVEINGMHRALHLFANPPEQDVADRTDPAVLYFGPGVHCPGLIRLQSHQTLYLAAGAVVYGAIFAQEADHIAIRGRGILDGSKFDRTDVDGLVSLVNCTHVRLEGITLRDPSGWTVVCVACRHVHIRHLKVIGNWRYNSDGIDLVSCWQCLIEDSFVRAYDDCIAIKGYAKWGPFIYRLQIGEGGEDGTCTFDHVTRRTFHDFEQDTGIYPCETEVINEIEVRRCVIWNDWGRALEIGAETMASEIRDILFEDCDIIHTTHVAIDIQNCDRAHCRNMVFRAIRIELDDNSTPAILQSRPEQVYEAKPGEGGTPQIIVLEIVKSHCSYDAERGCIHDIRFEDIEVTSLTAPSSRLHGYDADHLVENITITGFKLNGRRITNLEEGGIQLNEFARGVILVS